ncbi:MAG TPA: hypothetical protein VJS90_06880 [Pseudomonas sp.]|uniref:hypothetical protein n=1 Tax=Pseudomonas sp. TaxID=306 RepID=UPI002B4915C4|nr:hypothetical protein [Pseudomonas sp.]HKS12749.1 hypothetical protein [Pseudomonas sp.]
MAIYGVKIKNEMGIQTLGMEDFTIQRLATMEIAAAQGSGDGTRSDYITWNIPGYDPAKCFLLITPKAYAGYPQNGRNNDWGFLPTYRNLGGTQVAIFTYVNRRRQTGVGSDPYRDDWVQNTAHCLLEAVRVI